MAPAVETNLARHLFNGRPPILTQQACRFSDPNVVNETYRSCAEGFPEAFGEYRTHLREFLEQGSEVAVVADATAAAIHPELGDGYQTALTNFRFIANSVMSTEEAVSAM